MVIPSQCGKTAFAFVPTRVERRGGEIGKLTAMLDFIERKKAFVLVALLAASAAGANELVSYQLAADLPLKHDGYIVERRGTGNGERVKFVVKAQTARAFLYANYESNRWMNARSYPFVRDPHFKTRALDVSRSPEPLRDWIAATGANAVYFKRGRPDAKRLRECAALGVDAYSFLYGCDAAKWNRARYRFHTFMEDPVYRWSVATQNNGYNVPAEPGFYFGPELLDSAATFRGTRLPRKVK